VGQVSTWNHHTVSGAFRLAKVALRVLQEKGARNLSPEALAREVVDVVYEQSPVASHSFGQPSSARAALHCAGVIMTARGLGSAGDDLISEIPFPSANPS
jgi:hypothetical protein